MSLDGVGQASLVADREGAERIGDGGGQAARVDARGEFGCEFSSQRQAALGPATPVTKTAGNGQRREPVLLGQGVRDTRLVHGSGGLARRIGGEESRLARGSRGVFQDDGNGSAAFLVPAFEALEAIEDLVRVVVVGSGANRQRRQLAVVVRVRAPQAREGGSKGGDGEFEDGAHERGSSNGRIW